MNAMKITVMSRNPQRVEAIRLALAEKTPDAELSGGTGTVRDLPGGVNSAMPDVLILDGATIGDLDAVETLSLRRPAIDIIVISDEKSVAFLMRAMRAGVREVVPATDTGAALQGAIGHILHKRNFAVTQAAEGKVFAFMSCKGGGGATFLASNFAYVAAAEQGKRVALIDLNLQFGDAAMFVSNEKAPSSVTEIALQIQRLDATLLASAMLEAAPNFYVLAASDDPAHSTDVQRDHVEALVSLARQNYDAVVLDVPRSLDAVSLQALDMADLILPVMQLTLPFIRDSKRLLSLFLALDYPKESIKLLVNRYQEGGEISLGDLEQSLGHKVFRTIPNSYAAAVSSVNLGVPIAKAQRHNPVSKALVELAHELLPTERHKPGDSGWLARVLGLVSHFGIRV